VSGFWNLREDQSVRNVFYGSCQWAIGLALRRLESGSPCGGWSRGSVLDHVLCHWALDSPCRGWSQARLAEAGAEATSFIPFYASEHQTRLAEAEVKFCFKFGTKGIRLARVDVLASRSMISTSKMTLQRSVGLEMHRFQSEKLSMARKKYMSNHETFTRTCIVAVPNLLLINN